jgi:hypothetical protein
MKRPASTARRRGVAGLLISTAFTGAFVLLADEAAWAVCNTVL